MSWCQQIQHTYHPKLLSIGKIPHPLLQRMCRWCWEVGDQAWLGYWAGEEQESCKSQPLQLRINNRWKDSGWWKTAQQNSSHATSRGKMDMIKIQATANRTTRDFTSSYKCDPWFRKETGTMVEKVRVMATNSSKKMISLHGGTTGVKTNFVTSTWGQECHCKGRVVEMIHATNPCQCVQHSKVTTQINIIMIMGLVL